MGKFDGAQRERILMSQLALANKRLSQANADREYYIDAAHKLASF